MNKYIHQAPCCFWWYFFGGWPQGETLTFQGLFSNPGCCKRVEQKVGLNPKLQKHKEPSEKYFQIQNPFPNTTPKANSLSRHSSDECRLEEIRLLHQWLLVDNRWQKPVSDADQLPCLKNLLRPARYKDVEKRLLNKRLCFDCWHVLPNHLHPLFSMGEDEYDCLLTKLTVGWN